MYTKGNESAGTAREQQENHQRNCEATNRRLGNAAREGSTVGNEQNQVSYTNSPWGNSSREENISGRQGITGKVLSELRELRQSHLAFIDSHTKSLEVQLQKNEEYRTQISQSITSLEKEILEALESEETE